MEGKQHDGEIVLSLLGSFEAFLGERPFTEFATQKAQALLIYLVVEKERIHQRDALMTLLWPEPVVAKKH